MSGTTITRVDLRELLGSLGKSGLVATAIKEMLSAAAGHKVSRLSLRDEHLNLVRGPLERAGLVVVVSERKYKSARDVGKGNWSSKFVGETDPADKDGHWKVFLATEEMLAKEALIQDAVSDDDGIGAKFGIPKCCRKFYEASVRKAYERQGDFVTCTRDNTQEAPPYPIWTNYLSQYFGHCLLSFAACSFTCPEAQRVARETHEFLTSIDPDFAHSFLDHHKRSILFTEFNGIYMFEQGRLEGDTFHYRGFHGTDSGQRLFEHLTSGDRILLGDEGYSVSSAERELAVVGRSEGFLGVFE